MTWFLPAWTVGTAWLSIAAVLGLVVTLAIWARRPSKARGLSVLAFLVSLPVAAISLGSALGYPMPYFHGITIPPGKYKVLGGKIVENVALYVLIEGEDGLPRYVSLPYSTDGANSMQQAMDGAGGEVQVEINGEDGAEGQPQTEFSVTFPEPLPDKTEG